MVFLFLLLTCCSSNLLADAGVLIPSSEGNQPDPKKLSLADMRISVLVDNQTARVQVRQVFASHVGQVLEGRYLFGINPEALVSDFAVWDGVVRIPGVIMERKRAEEIYDALRWQFIDPGLLQQAEEGEEGGSRVSFFSAKITPIPGYGTKRLELEYTEQLPLERLQSYFYFPLKPRQFQNQPAAHLRIDLTLRHALPMAKFKQANAAFPLAIDRQSAREIQAHYEGSDVSFADDFAFTYELKSPSELSVLFYRSRDNRFLNAGLPITAFERPMQNGTAVEPGYFQASALFHSGPSTPTKRPPSLFFLLFDTSLSIRWDKLERQFEALEKVLHHLEPLDRFQLILFNSNVASFRPRPVAASKENVAAALEFVKKSHLFGGSDLKRGIEAVLEQVPAESELPVHAILLSDANPTIGVLSSKRIASWFAAANHASGGTRRLRFNAYGIGNDCNKILLRELTQSSGGIFEFAGETEATGFKLSNFISKLTLEPFLEPQLRFSQNGNFLNVYRSPEGPIFEQGLGHWVGQYREPMSAVTFTVSAKQVNGALELKKSIDVPAEASEHLFIPRNWAKARVDFLLHKIELEGEDTDSINEIIQLSKKFKFVTPYTSFLAAPRSLLRPRLIKPGDPILRVRTDPDISSLQAIFPFGLSKPLRYLPREGVWQTRFLAPKEMVDGTYHCRLILRDKRGRVYEEKKSFIIDSRAPVIQASADRGHYRPGETIQVKVRADADTRRIQLRLGNLEPVEARWDGRGQASLGYIVLPLEIPTGRHAVEVYAEDFAHNVSSARVFVSVVQ